METSAVFLALALAGSPALADVLEIAPDGTVIRHAGPAVLKDKSRTAIVAPVAARPVSTGAPEAVDRAIHGASRQYQLSPDLIAAVAWQESRYRQTALSPKGARGVMQLMPGTARSLGVDGADLDQNVRGGTAYLTQMLNRYHGNIELALAAYNAGPGAVDRHGGIPPFAETRAYVAAIMERMASLAAARE